MYIESHIAIFVLWVDLFDILSIANRRWFGAKHSECHSSLAFYYQINTLKNELTTLLQCRFGGNKCVASVVARR